MFGSCEQIIRTQPCFVTRHAVMQVYGMMNRQWPELRVGGFRPVDGGVEHHGTCTRHYCLNCSLSYSVVVVSSSASVGDLLLQGL